MPLLLISLGAKANSRNYNDKNYNTKLQIINHQNGKMNQFIIARALSESEREQGLMWVTDLPKNYGMIFEFAPEQMVYMWMKNTKIPLDMLFIDKNDQIINIKHQATPESLDIISSLYKVTRVLEINGGVVNNLGIRVGDKVIY